MNITDLDDLEDILLENLKGQAEEGRRLSAAHLDLVRKLLEKNNRLYVKPSAKDPGPMLKELEGDLGGPMALPFRRVK